MDHCSKINKIVRERKYKLHLSINKLTALRYSVKCYVIVELTIIKQIMFTGNLRERGDNGLFIILNPKVLVLRFLIRWPDKFGDFRVNLDWLVKKVECSKRFTH